MLLRNSGDSAGVVETVVSMYSLRGLCKVSQYPHTWGGRAWWTPAGAEGGQTDLINNTCSLYTKPLKKYSIDLPCMNQRGWNTRRALMKTWSCLVAC